MIALSQSMLTTASNCRRLFKHQFVDKLPVPGPESGDQAFGTAVHIAVEAMLTGSSDYMHTFELFWDLEGKKNLAYGRYDHADLLRQARILLPRFETRYASKFKIHQMEQRLYGEVAGFKFEGTPDFIGEYAGVPSVVDFKTSGYRYPREKARVGEQMFLYAELARQAGYEVEQVVYMVFVKGKEPSLQNPVVQKLTPALMQDTLSNIVMQAAELSKTEYPRNPNHCVRGEATCPFLTTCFPDLQKEKQTNE